MSIKDSREFPAQVFGGGGRGDALDEFGSSNRGVKLDDIAYSIQEGVAKRS